MSRDDEWGWGAREHVLCSSDAERAEIEAENSVRLTEHVLDLVEMFNGVLQLTPELILELHRLATIGVLASAGSYRRATFLIVDASHVPPRRSHVGRLVEEMCMYANLRCTADPIHVAAYLMWRLNWIHPFEDGNGRVSRALADVALCVGFGGTPTGPPTIATLLLQHRQEYLDGLAAADKAEPSDDHADVRSLESLLAHLLVEQAIATDLTSL